MTKIQDNRDGNIAVYRFENLDFGHSILFRISDFVLRI